MVTLKKSHGQLFCTFSFSPWLVHWDLPRPAACKERWINKVILPQHFYSAVSIFSAMDVLNVNFFPGLVLWYFFKDDFHHWVFLAYGSSSRWPLPISPILWPTKKLNIIPSCSTFRSSCKLRQPLFQILEVVMDSSRATFPHSALSANVMALVLWCLYRRLYRE